MADTELNLPPLPEPDVHTGDEAFGDAVSSFSPAAMRSYGEACRRAATKAAAPADAPTAPMCERKTNDIIQREGYKKTGYVLRKEGADICVVDGGAVAWFTLDQWNWLMFNRMHTTFDWPKPIGWRTPAEDAREEVQDERALFEAWARDPIRAEKLPLDRWPTNDGYKDYRTYIAFYGWKAGRASSTPAVPGTGWISVDDERKPDVGETVLLWVRTLTRGWLDDMPVEGEGAQVEMGNYRRGESDEMSYFDCYASPISDNDWITHWMPLPAGPSEAKAGSEA